MICSLKSGGCVGFSREKASTNVFHVLQNHSGVFFPVSSGNFSGFSLEKEENN